jgi:hypothetical protein
MDSKKEDGIRTMLAALGRRLLDSATDPAADVPTMLEQAKQTVLLAYAEVERGRKRSRGSRAAGRVRT